MLLGLKAIGSGLYQILSRLALSFGANVTALAFSIPILLIVFVIAALIHSLGAVPIGMAILVGILPNPGSIGLQYLARELAHGRAPDLREQWIGLRGYWRLALKFWLISTAVTVICLLNVTFYASQAAAPSSALNGAAGPLSVVWAVLLLFWLGMHVYVAPLLVGQEAPTIKLVYRNAAVLTASRTFASWTVILVWFAVLLISSATGLATFIGLALAAAIQQNAFRLLVPTFAKS